MSLNWVKSKQHGSYKGCCTETEASQSSIEALLPPEKATVYCTMMCIDEMLPFT